MLSDRSLTISRRLSDACSWVCLAANVLMWVLAYRWIEDPTWRIAFWVLLAARIFGGLRSGGRLLGARVALFADRVVWYGIGFAAFLAGDLARLLVVGALVATWGVVAGLGRYWYALAASDTERQRVAQLAKL